MKSNFIIIILSIITLIHCDLFAQDDSNKLKGPYLGQEPPGVEPQVFAPGIISTDANEGCSSFSKDGKLFLFTRGNSPLSGILMMEQVDGVWSNPQLAPFSVGKLDWDFMLAPNSKAVYISSGRPIHQDSSSVKDYRIWISEKTNNGWTEPRLLPYPVNSGHHDSYPSLTDDDVLYFFSYRDGGHGEADIYKSKKLNGQYTKVEILDDPVNSQYSDLDSFIAPDESYLIICSDRPGGFGSYDIYISFQETDGTWTIPVNMGNKINSPASEYIPSVSPDGKYFFFTSNKSGDRDIYWMDSRIIEELKNNE